jgi:catechol 2,3-dioxygenase-like lactoylglutathione lyase family enzyme
MGLQDSPVGPAIAVSDMERAKEFYEGKLGLSGGKDQPDGGCTYTCGDGTQIHVFPSAHARASGATVAGWVVDDVSRTVDELVGRGVTFEQYSEPFQTDERGLARMGDMEGAWFKDPDGNVLAISNF